MSCKRQAAMPLFRLFSFVACLADAFKVLDVGAPRTGTQSMHAALDVLGFKTLHSGYEWHKRQAWCSYVFEKGPLAPALATLEGYDAAMDEPFQLVYEEIMEAFPSSKFILTISDPEKWYHSYVDLATSMKTVALAVRGAGNNHSGLPKICTAARYWGCDFANASASEESKKQCVENYLKHNEQVQQIIPADRLLVYNWADGWAPLAHFMGKAIPDEDFPHQDFPKLIFETLSPPDHPISFLQESLQVENREL
mmetsp:Transcript_63222/g.148475  ORF Transcript_63222/g.148475 Transcript_63222/m.148475 type:complete len:253 (-) Transcript_63222:29-787(-)